jgi:hypothetical protein
MFVFRIVIDLLIIVLSTIVLTIVVLAYNAPETLSELGCTVTNGNVDNYYCRTLNTP